MIDDIRIGSLDGLTVGEAACPDDAGAFEPTNEDERANSSLAAYAQEIEQ